MSFLSAPWPLDPFSLCFGLLSILYSITNYSNSQNLTSCPNSAGGGGAKSEARKAKLIDKNKKLQEQRARAAKESLKHKKSMEKGKGVAEGAEASSTTPMGLVDVHPSRKSRVPGA